MNCHFLQNSVIFCFLIVTSFLSFVKKKIVHTYFLLTKINTTFTIKANGMDKTLEFVKTYQLMLRKSVLILRVKVKSGCFTCYKYVEPNGSMTLGFDVN